jgi:hypothetical protein
LPIDPKNKDEANENEPRYILHMQLIIAPVMGTNNTLGGPRQPVLRDEDQKYKASGPKRLSI